MAALTEDRKTPQREGVDIEYPVAGSSEIFGGSMVCANASGYAASGADTSGFKFLGVAQEYVDNSDGSDGDKKVVVRRKGVFRFAASGMAITDVGESVYIVDDQTVAKSTTNSVACGRIVEYISATEVGVDIDMR